MKSVIVDSYEKNKFIKEILEPNVDVKFKKPSSTDIPSHQMTSNSNQESYHKKSHEMPWSEVFLRGLYGAVACGAYLNIQRTLFNQPLPIKDLIKVTSSCGIRAVAMGTVTKAIRQAYKNFDSTENTFLKDAGEVGIITAVETAASYVQDKTTAKDISPLNVLGLSFIKSAPNNAMDTKTYQNWTKLSSPINEEKTHFIMNTLVAFLTSIPATFLNNENLTPVNFTKTVGLRWLSVNLWRKAMRLAEQHGNSVKNKDDSLKK